MGEGGQHGGGGQAEQRAERVALVEVEGVGVVFHLVVSGAGVWGNRHSKIFCREMNRDLWIWIAEIRRVTEGSLVDKAEFP
ncbi:hypothetical protein AGMMS49960_10660 [Betaproteobacteria bacterium]|nr:hypothetical protein AGMMS49543_12870 [Betaproteobacteria bacterium]GHU01102.1 hypothetical protein AGMMS49960_10660 [Betaproteobacteria bacterium]GHU17980.1 hypothetical protein AGMMS50243_07160 [Betaproteobacteria bacterium]